MNYIKRNLTFVLKVGRIKNMHNLVQNILVLQSKENCLKNDNPFPFCIFILNANHIYGKEK